MFNLLVMGGGWKQFQDNLAVGRVFEYTEDHIINSFRNEAGIDFQSLSQYPALFMPEQNSGDNLARVGAINRVTHRAGGDVTIEYSFDPNILAVSVDCIANIADQLQMHDFEFSRTHWAVKNVDLYRILLKLLNPRRNRPDVFELSETMDIDQSQMSVMMPFDAGFAGVYQAIQRAGQGVGMRVQRADDIWVHRSIIQDIVTLIDRSRIVVADCTGKNPNVFYEVGIAHAIGREVILITQHIDDVPFDLRHLRAITYLPNGEGLAAMEAELRSRVQTLLTQH